MAKPELDPLSGYKTTGHEWDGIKELTTPIPGWWVTTFLVCCIIAVLYMWLYPSIPTTSTYYGGKLGWSSKGQLAEDVAAGREAQSAWRQRLAQTPIEEIEADEDLRRFATAGGRAAFRENCAPCHGEGAGGQIGQFPSLIDDDWIWGGKITDIQQTIRFGIRSGHEDARDSMMPAFGDMLAAEEIDAVATYVQTLADPSAEATRASLPGAAIFAQNCASCHGDLGQGGRDFGAPRLNDAIWLYGGSKEAIKHQVTRPRMGVMPTFATKLEDETISMLAVYVHMLGGGER
jgi:cytochrome c oxidase cbb3-type subunit 3